MKRSELEHIIRAASMIADDDEVIIIGSQAIFGRFLTLPTHCVFPSKQTSIQRTALSAGTSSTSARAR